ncbi:hypothetical protein V1511DRAFT_457122 [Dipodascopsis uninucleata]
MNDNPEFLDFYRKQIKEAVESFKLQLTRLSSEELRYHDLSTTLEEYPKKLRHDVMIPISPRALVKGEIEHTNEIYAAVGDGYIIKRSAHEASKMAQRTSDRKESYLGCLKAIILTD